MAPFIAAIRFLTIFPLPGNYGTGQDELAVSIPFFPIVGLGLGAIAWGLSWIFQIFFPPMLTATLMTCVLLAFSGGLHLDGLADTADGFFSARSRKRILGIMRDSHIGVMGVIALVMVLLLKFSSLATLDRAEVMRAVLLMPIAGRCAIVIFMALLPYARPQGGLATLFYSNRSRLAGLWAFFFFTVSCCILYGLRAIVVVAFFSGTILLFAWLCKKIINGATGDTLGAVCELSEAMTALSAVLIWHLN